jgi:hypothetical protein
MASLRISRTEVPHESPRRLRSSCLSWHRSRSAHPHWPATAAFGHPPVKSPVGIARRQTRRPAWGCARGARRKTPRRSRRRPITPQSRAAESSARRSDFQPAASLEGLTFTRAICSHDHVPPAILAVYCSPLQVFGSLLPCLWSVVHRSVVSCQFSVLGSQSLTAAPGTTAHGPPTKHQGYRTTDQGRLTKDQGPINDARTFSTACLMRALLWIVKSCGAQAAFESSATAWPAGGRKDFQKINSRAGLRARPAHRAENLQRRRC